MPLVLQCTSAQYNFPANSSVINKAFSFKSSEESSNTHNFIDPTTQLTSTTIKEWGSSFASSTPKTINLNNLKHQNTQLTKPIEPTYFHWNVSARKNNRNNENLNKVNNKNVCPHSSHKKVFLSFTFGLLNNFFTEKFDTL